MTTPRELKEMYGRGENISAFLRREQGVERNTRAIIEVAYDLQTGSYVAAMEDPAMAAHSAEYTGEIARRLLALGRPTSVLEAGVGEATTLSGVLKALGAEVRGYGFDLSWSRVAQANAWLRRAEVGNALLCTGDLFAIPFRDDSIDIVYTSHSIEPNGGSEDPILRELYRVTREYLVLLEPGYELAGAEARARMESHGYCRNLRGVSESLGFDVRAHELFPFTVNPLNPTAVTIVRKGTDAARPSEVLACPRFKTELQKIGGVYFSPEALVAYPVVDGVPCLRVENGIFASKYAELARG